MAKQAKRSTVYAAFKKLSDFEQKIVRTKTLQGEYSPEMLLDHLGDIQQYSKAFDEYRKARNAQKKKRKERRRVLMVVASFTIVSLLISYIIFAETRYFFHLGLWVVAVAGLLWGGWMLWRQRQEQTLRMENHVLDFLLPFLLILTDEIRPGTRLRIELNFDKGTRRKYTRNVYRNHSFAMHKLFIWGFWITVIAYFAYLALGFIFPETLPRIFPKDLDFILVFLGVFMFFPAYMIILAIAASFFGKDPKVTTQILKIPRILLQAKLVDGTALHIEAIHVLALKTAVKKKYKSKNFQLTKVKKKHKVKTVTTLKLAFPQKKYPIDAVAFSSAFDQKPRLMNKSVAKVKVKHGENKQVVVYQDVQTGEALDHRLISYQQLSLDRLLKLVIEGGFHKLKSADLENKGEAAKEFLSRDDLTKIKGVGKTTEGKLNGLGIFTYQQIANMSQVNFFEIIKEIGVNKKAAHDWQLQALRLFRE